MTTSLTNKWVMITGASSGFGEAAAVAFAESGARLLLGARRVDRIERVADLALKAGAPEARYHSLDVAKTSSVNDFMAWAGDVARKDAASPPKLDVLVNNAGGAHGLDTIAEAADGDWEAMIQSNVLGLLRMIRAAIPLMINNPGASIVNIGSVAGRTAYEGGAAYCAAKAGERKITQSLRLELCGTGIRVGSIDPGLADTEFSLVRFKGDAARAAKVYEGMTPLSARDIAETLVWVASRPPHVNIDEILIKPTDQAAIHKVYRRGK